MNKTFSISLLVQPLIASAAIVISLFCVMVNFWIAGIGYIIFAYTQLISMCAVGQSVQNNVSFIGQTLDQYDIEIKIAKFKG